MLTMVVKVQLKLIANKPCGKYREVMKTPRGGAGLQCSVTSISVKRLQYPSLWLIFGEFLFTALLTIAGPALTRRESQQDDFRFSNKRGESHLM